MGRGPRAVRWNDWILLVLSCCLALGLAEVVVRVTWGGRPMLYEPDPIRGVALRPGAHGRWSQEGGSWVEINAAGLRDREHTVSKPPGTLRVAVLGDSYAEAAQVRRESAFWAVAERELGACPALGGRAVEAINFGVAGYGTAQELLTLRHVAWSYAPDVVVLAFLTGNDVRNNSRALERDPMRPYYVMHGDGLALDDSFLHDPGWLATQTRSWRLKLWLSSHFRLVQLVNEARASLREPGRPPPGDGNQDEPIYAPPRDARWVQAWQVTERLLRALHEEVVAGGAAFQLLVLTNSMQVHPDREVRARFAASLGVDDLLYPDRRIEAFARQEEIPALMLVDRFRSEAESRGICLHGFPNALPCGGHWNEEGHRLGGRLLAERLCERLARGELGPRRP